MTHLDLAIQQFDTQKQMAERIRDASGLATFTTANITNWKKRGVPPIWWSLVAQLSNEKAGEEKIHEERLKEEYFEKKTFKKYLRT